MLTKQNTNVRHGSRYLVRAMLLGAMLIFSARPGHAGEAEAIVSLPSGLAGIEVLDLETAQRLALDNNPGLQSALARVEQARARLRQAAAAWWPTLDLTGSGGYIRRSDKEYEIAQFFPPIAGQSTDRTYSQASGGLQAAWVLFDGLYRSFNEQQARYAEKSARAARIDAQRLLVAAVAEAFLNAQLAQANTRIAEADRDFYLRRLEDAQSRYEVGAGPWGDVLNIKVQLNAAKTSALFAAREFEAAGYGLAALMGLPDARFPAHLRLQELGRDLDVREETVSPDALIREALARRPDIRQLALAVTQAEAAVGKAEAGFYPRLQLTGGVNGVRQGELSLTGEDFGNTLLLNLSWNLFAGGLDRARRVEADQARREAEYLLLNLRNRVASEVRQGIALLEAAREQVILQRESVRLVEENRELARSEYEAGQASLVRLNEAQRDLTATYGRLALAQVAFLQARQRLLASTGRNIARFVEAVAAEDYAEQND